METSNQKPLPAVPDHLSSLHNMALTIEARAHRRKFLEHRLAEDLQASFSDSQIESWVTAFESALDDLGESISRGGWLTGLKRRRNAVKAWRDQGKSGRDVAKLKKEKEVTEKEMDENAVAEPSDEQLQRSDEANQSSPPAQGHGEATQLALQQIRDLISQPSLPTPNPSYKHLLLCLSPFANLQSFPGTSASENIGSFIQSADATCIFSTALFALPEAQSDEYHPSDVILYGLDEWQVTPTPATDADPLQIVGGTFSFKRVPSLAQHTALSKVLRFAIYMHFSLLLEQAFLSDSNVELQFPKPKSLPSIPLVPLPATAVEHEPTAFNVKPKSKSPFLSGGGLFSFFSRKAESFLSGTTSTGPMFSRGNSVDLIRTVSGHNGEQLPRTSQDSASHRLRPFSFLSDGRSSPVKEPPQDEFLADPPHAAALKRVEKSLGLLSTSAGVSFMPPSLLVTLADKERKDPSRRLKGDEKAGLTSILGWEGKDDRGKGMAGALGFLRQQEFSVLYAQHVPASLTPPAPEASESGSNSPSSSSHTSHHTVYTPCDRPRWITFHYYARESGAEKTLGEAVEDLCSMSEEPCRMSGCHFKRREHEIRWVHAGVLIAVKVDVDDKDEEKGSAIEVWESCKICHAQTQHKEMGDGTYLYSFGKFLEVLVYSPAICTLTPALCEHTTPPPQPWPSTDSPLPRSRLNIIRHFSFRSRSVSFTLSTIEDIFELVVPRLQILRSADQPAERRRNDQVADPSGEGEKRILRREISSWWQGVNEHIDQLEQQCGVSRPESYHKSLPRLPSADDAYDELETDSSATTPKAQLSELPALPPSIPNTPALEKDLNLGTNGSASDDSHESTANPPRRSMTSLSQTSQDQDPAQLLSNLRHNFQRNEQSLYVQLGHTPISSLNIVRRAFHTAARGASRRLLAWQTKHLPQTVKGKSAFAKLSAQEPEWWNKECHVEGGGNIIVRENDWGSIIAFTLSSLDFQQELAKMSGTKSTPPVALRTPEPSLSAPNQTSFFSNTKLFTSNPMSTPDPDQEGIVWHEPETYSAVISRKEHPRDPTALLSIREVLRKAPADGTTGLPASRFGTFNNSNRALNGTPRSAWAKPAVEVSMHAADGIVSGLPEDGGTAGKILHEMEAARVNTASRSTSSLGSDTTASELLEAHIRRGKALSIMSSDSDITIGPDTAAGPQDMTPSTSALPKPKSEDAQKDPGQSPRSSELPVTQSSFTASLTTSLTNAMRYVINTGEIPRMPSPMFKNHHGLLTIDALGIDERPHIKYDWTIGRRVRFSCTVYYAKQFDALRRRCGLGDGFLKSLGRSANWSAEGGKSKSNFWKTADDRYIIKTLVNAWNVADLQVLLELGPSYFRYMDATASKPTVLAKLLGFYTVEIKNLESGNTKSKADLLVMENLFHDHTVSKTFDLKGIQGRKVKAGPTGSNLTSKTLFDGEWIEGQQRTLTLVHPHSKVILQEAIKRDSEFLAQSNIMDYSLLLGIDEKQKQIACGLVDTIGSYTFAKTLEYKAKQGLNSGKNITVVPPQEYQERFVSAIEGYFLACPDKWSRPVDDSDVINDPNLLPSVL